jgi:hypothetical protein
VKTNFLLEKLISKASNGVIGLLAESDKNKYNMLMDKKNELTGQLLRIMEADRDI